MSTTTVGYLVFLGLLILIAARTPIGIAMFIAGATGYCYLIDWNWTVFLASLKNLAYARLSNYDLAVIPLFLLMGQFATKGGLSRGLFNCVGAFVGHFRGGIAYAAIGACAGFGAICGSSVATAATMGQVALPELRRYGYKGSLATGALAAGGTLGILIPPSIPLVIYAILTQESIGKLFTAAVIPGLLATLGYMTVVRIIVSLDSDAGPAGPKTDWPDRIRSLLGVIPILLVFVIVIFGIYAGWTNATEAAAVGAAACGAIAVAKGGFGWRALIDSLLGTAQSTAMIMLILLGADMMNTALAVSQLPAELASTVSASGLSSLLVIAGILLIYIFLGCVMDSLAMILLTIPIFYPVVMSLDFFGLSAADKSIWFGILALTVVEIGLIHPPVGLNVYIINRMAKDIPLGETFKGVIPFLVSDLIRIVALVLFPTISLVLVRYSG